MTKPLIMLLVANASVDFDPSGGANRNAFRADSWRMPRDVILIVLITPLQLNERVRQGISAAQGGLFERLSRWRTLGCSASLCSFLPFILFP